MAEVVSVVDVLLNSSAPLGSDACRVTAFITWLESYYELWLTNRDDDVGTRFSLTISVSDIWKELELVTALADLGQSRCMNLSLIVDASYLRRLPAKSVAEMAGHEGITTIGVSVQNGMFAATDWTEMVEALEEGRPQINLIGDYTTISTSGILNSARTLNLVIYPKQRELPIGWQMLTPSPCKDRFRVVVTSDGLIYPCAGLVGYGGFVIGSIYDAFENVRYLRGMKDSDQDRLYQFGPIEGPVEAKNVQNGMPAICLLHREILNSA
ncbi:hypothetical protein [Mesorhizobium sp. M7A.F.Ca.MR.362.00.0.0]|uniref:hypothetical protein n=1 Tax=Mesorhizobium sp. M7A.F.Ca.MR.362.00.0.0 TaxID=2496779 RepID=UPI000FD49497|nr:hypothetical protein [Mesorhizobium sp. M7A.F.Ca.MR.362.00.0.0]RUU82746.1 hypothetical protein EOC06_02850 [Mesorhizobium sp. M7A.F.Ca.MR.362.00.0.0]RWN96574.1 MAG: hypothetical protein EOS05_01115 [Mesorhizobium sp.]